MSAPSMVFIFSINSAAFMARSSLLSVSSLSASNSGILSSVNVSARLGSIRSERLMAYRPRSSMLSAIGDMQLR